MTYLKPLCLLAVTLALCWFLGEAAYTQHVLRPKLAVTISNIDRTIIVIGAAATHVEIGARAWEKSSTEQASKTTTAMSAVAASAERLSIFVSKMDDSVNSGFLPALTQSINQQNASLLQSQESLRQNLSEMLQATQTLQKTLADADSQISSPEITKSLASLAASAQNTAEATRHLSNIAADGEKTADYYTKRLTTPQSFLKTVAQAILQLGSQARILFNK